MKEAFEKILERLEEKAIPVLDEDEHIIPENNIREPYEIEMVVLSDAKKIVQEVAEEYNNGWIPCSVRLPEEDGFYLATLDGEIVGEEKSFSGLAEFENGKWVDDDEDYQCIKAWQPLPEPYKESED